eukprot:5125539-Ditylum_brightwellii.AAC.1
MKGEQLFDEEALVEEVADTPADKPIQDTDSATNSVNTDDSSIKWMPLVSDAAFIEEPQNIIHYRAPIVPDEEADNIPVKHNVHM